MYLNQQYVGKVQDVQLDKECNLYQYFILIKNLWTLTKNGIQTTKQVMFTKVWNHGMVKNEISLFYTIVAFFVNWIHHNDFYVTCMWAKEMRANKNLIIQFTWTYNIGWQHKQ